METHKEILDPLVEFKQSLSQTKFKEIHTEHILQFSFTTRWALGKK